MDSLTTENLMTTKDASELSGYTSDYLARLVRAGDIAGKRFGHSWLIDKASLEIFLEQQKNRKMDRAREVATARAEEYRKHHQLIRRATRNLTEEMPEPQFDFGRVSLRSHVVALSVALAVVFSGAALARSDMLPQLGGRIAAIAQKTASGFGAMSGDVSARIASRIDSTNRGVDAISQRVAAMNATASAQLASPLLASPDLSPLHMTLGTARPGSEASEPAPRIAPLTSVAEAQASMASSFAVLTSPTQLTSALLRAYLATGTAAYGGITASLVAYRAFIERSGAAALALATVSRDALAAAPHLITAALLGTGHLAIDASHAAIHADVVAAYGLAAAAPASARVTVVLMGGVGDALAGATARVPALATAAYLRATAVPATLAPKLAQAVFGAEYDAALRFVTLTAIISDKYLAFVEAAGRAAYTGADGTRSLASSFTHMPGAIEDAYLGMIGKTALALGPIAKAPAAAGLAPTQTLSVGEQVALSVYQTINAFFDSTSRSLASLFSPVPPLVIAPSGAPSVRPTISSSVSPALPATTTVPVIATPPSTVRQTVNSYPTYTTVVRGVSQDSMTQSLAALRDGILATVAGMIQPVAVQGAVNANTIQYVNMIQDLSNLTVHNGSFLGGTFDGGNLTSGIGVTATNGYFTNLTGGATNLATTSVTGNLAIAGSASITGSLTIGTTTITGPLTAVGPASLGDIVTAGSFVATGTTSTSTFAGSLAIDTNGLVYSNVSKNVGIGVLSPGALLAIRNSTSTQPIFTASNAAGAEKYRLTDAGFIGLGTSTPDALLSLLQPANGTTVISAYRSTDVAPSGDFINYKSAAGVPLFRVDNSGNITGGTSLFNGALTVNGNSLFANGFLSNASSTVTSGLFSMNGGASTTLATVATGLYNTYLTTGRVPYTTTNGLLTDSANLTFDGTTLATANDALIHGLTVGLGGGAASGNTAFGYQSLFNNSGGNFNTAFGYQSLYANTTGSNNVANGTYALVANTTSIQNTASGGQSLDSNTTGSYNVASGFRGLYLNTTGSYNVAAGYYAGLKNTTGSNNTFLGYNAGDTDGVVTTPGTLTNATAIGYNAQVTANNSLILGGTGAYGVNVGIGTTSPYATLSVVGSSALGTVVSGTWNGTPLTSPYINFGTGANQVSATTIPTTDTGNYYVGTAANVNASLQNIGQERSERWSTGLVSGGVISAATGNQINITAGVGYIGTTRVTWNASTSVAMLYNGDNYIALDANGAVNIAATQQNPDNYIALGYVYTVAGNTAIGIISSLPFYAGNYDARNNNFINHSLGAIVENGSIVSETTPLALIATSGTINANLKEFTVADVTTFTKWYDTSDNGWVQDTANNLVNTTNYNIATNTQATALVPMTTGYWKKDLIVRALDGSLHYVYGQAQYATEQAAKDGPLPTIPTAILNSGNVYLATAVVQNGDTSLANRLYDVRPNLARVFGFGTSGTTGSVASHSALSGLLADDHPQYVLTNGGRLMTGNLQLNSNAITGVTNLTMAGLLQNTLTTEQMRLRYDASNYASFTVGATGGLTITPSGSATTTIANGLLVGTELSVPYLTATSASAISTIAGGLTVGTNSLVVNPTTGNVGIGTSTPGSLLSLGGIANFTTATSTFYSSGGINLTSGCFAVNGVCAGTGTGSVGAGTQGQLPFFAAAGTTLTATSSIFLAQNSNVGIGTTNPGANIDVNAARLHVANPLANGDGLVVEADSAGRAAWFVQQGYTNTSVPAKGAFVVNIINGVPYIEGFQSSAAGSNFANLAIAPRGGNVGIGTSTPTKLLSIAGDTPTELITNTNSAMYGNLMFTENGTLKFGIYQIGSANTSGAVGGANAVQLWNFANSPMLFGTNGIERMRIDPTGNVGIGNLTPATALQVAGDIRVGTSGTNGCLQNFAGTALAGTCSSDQRLKTVTGNVTNVLDRISSLQLMNFNWNDLAASLYHNATTTENTGFMAQSVQQVFPELVSTDAKGYERLDYTTLGLYGLEAIKELNQRTSFIQSAATSTVLTVDVAGNVGVGTPTPTAKLTVSGSIFSTSYEASPAIATGYVLDASTTVAVLPADVLTATGNVDLYKLATYSLSGVQALAAKIDAQGMRLTALENRVTALESGSISVASGPPMSFSSPSLASAFSAFGALIGKGIAQFNTLVFRQLVASTDANGNSSAGSATILAGNTAAQVNNAFVLPTTKIFVTFNSKITGSWWVSDKAAGSFRVILTEPQAGDVSFDYLLVQTVGQIATPAADGSFPSVPGSTGSTGPDTVPPVITILGDNPLHISVGGVFTDPGVQVTDAVDGVDPYITFINGTQQEVSAASIDTSAPTTYIVTYKATDAAGNSSTAHRSIIIGNPDGTVSTGSGSTTPAPIVIASSTPPVTDSTPPVVTLIGAAAMQIDAGGTFVDPGATALDDTDGSLTSKIKETGSVDTAAAGLYTLTYSATDAAGNTGSASRVVSVVAAPSAASSTPATASSTPAT